MKRYIKAAFVPDIDIDCHIFDGTPFKCDTDMDWYNRFLKKDALVYQQNHKHLTGEVVMMSPMEYFVECANRIFHGRYSVDDLRRSRSDEYGPYAEYMEAMKNGAKFPMPVLDYSDDGQEGLHRMQVAGDLYGWDTQFPVLVVMQYNPVK